MYCLARTKWIFFAIAVSLSGLVRIASGESLSPEAIIEKNFHVSKVFQLTTESTMTLIHSSGQQRIRKMYNVSVLQPNGIDSKVLIRFRYPGDIEGTGFLQIEHHDGDDDMWIYLPALKKIRRLVTNNKNDSFFGSDFSYGDILAPAVSKYRYSLLRMDALDGEDCWVIESEPTTEQVRHEYGYGKRVSWIRKSNFMEKQIEYYDVGQRLLKTQWIPEARQVDSSGYKWWGLRREVLNHKTGHRTLLTFERVDTEKPVPDDLFTPRYLEREK